MTGIDTLQNVISSATNLLGAVPQSSDPANEVKLIANNKEIAGWTRVRMTRGVERLPSEFDIEATEHFPGRTSSVPVQPGDPCQIMVGKDLLLTGYIDRFIPSFDDGSHTIRIVGRSKCEDLVDCSAEWDGGQILGPSAVDVATRLCAPYGIEVKPQLAIDQLRAIPQFNLIYGETPASVLERICRFSGLLYYDDVDGNLLLSRVGKVYAGSGFTQGVNIQRASASFCVDERFTEYFVALQAVDVWTDLGKAGNLRATAKDDGFRAERNRKKIIVCESGKTSALEFAQQRANWEANRRKGRAFAVQLTTDTWRDANGKLWQPNTLASLDIPALKILNDDYVISEVSFTLDGETGRTAHLTMMPPMAFDIQPIQINPFAIIEANPRITPPGGNQNPGTPNLPPPDNSPAISSTAKPVHNPMTPSDAADALKGLYGY